ncbi:CoA pyrophosphatase [Acerihabitans sp. TG2]|uniref:CoA pyrophosphatase n=1 Tax=Acerihabitans sp. TG2 TaxID=3096008 RepID=UPI002B23D7DE|nr:CoA pyrophosphatase [Acerihabitans sp. TG2]MEA9389499.1 CoA pyrophosphatase [Acerihabitans sp. TG2]
MKNKNNTLALAEFIARFQLQPPGNYPPSRNLRQAAVLIPIICHQTPTVLLTRRASSLRKHAGQVAFPGGSADPGDDSLIATALREAQEEVSIPSNAVRILGQLPPVDSNSGFQVTPIIGLLDSGTSFHASRDEVSEIFEIPLHQALTLASYTPLQIQRNAKTLRVYFSWYQSHMVWGMTAQILYRLGEQIHH